MDANRCGADEDTNKRQKAAARGVESSKEGGVSSGGPGPRKRGSISGVHGGEPPG